MILRYALNRSKESGMSLFSFIFGTTKDLENGLDKSTSNSINPATGLPMNGPVDIAGNLFGQNPIVQHNPSTGLPALGGVLGGIDIGGNIGSF